MANDYKLINSLLEDGSYQAILKLKMIVDFDDFILGKINKNYRFNFVVLFKEAYDKMFSKNPTIICYIPKNKVIETLKLFKNSFEEGFLFCPRAISDVPSDIRRDVIEMFKESFDKVGLICKKNGIFLPFL